MFIAVAAPSDPRIKLIESLLTRYGLSNRWIAAKLGTSHTNVNGWLAGDFAPRDKGIFQQMLEIVETEGKKNRQVKMERGGTRFIPVYSGLPAGIPGSVQSDVDYEEILDWGSDLDRWGRVIEGYSMASILLPGDIAIFENRRFETGDVVHAYKDGEEVVKAIRGSGEATEMWSFNEDFSPFPASDWKAKGVCVGRIRYGSYRTRQHLDWPHGLKWPMRQETF